MLCFVDASGERLHSLVEFVGVDTFERSCGLQFGHARGRRTSRTRRIVKLQRERLPTAVRDISCRAGRRYPDAEQAHRRDDRSNAAPP